MSVLQTTGNNCLLTKEPVLALVRRICGGSIRLDPCTHPTNPTGAEAFCALEDGGDGLAGPWPNATFWNPPFGQKLPGKGPSQVYAWAEHARRQVHGIKSFSVGLMPCDTGRQSSRSWHKSVLCDEMLGYFVFNERTKFDILVDGVREDYAAHLKELGGKKKGGPTYTCALYLYGDIFAPRARKALAAMRDLDGGGSGTFMPGKAVADWSLCGLS
jgi:hypothetical protein